MAVLKKRPEQIFGLCYSENIHSLIQTYLNQLESSSIQYEMNENVNIYS